MKRTSAFFLLCVLFTGIYIIVSCSRKSTESAADSQYASLSDSTPYVGMQACRQCHEAIYQTFIRTGMGLSFDTASQKKTSARFEHAPLYDRFSDFYYKPFWNGDSLYLKEYRLDGGDTVYSRIEKVSYIIGSGQHTNSHMMNVNGYVTQVPVTFYTQKGHWDLPPGFGNGFNSRFSRKIELECMSCHNAFPEIVPGSENKYLRIPDGIDCERCHGPGGEHVRQRQGGEIVDVSKEIDYSIVHPGKLPIDLQLDVCQRCHIQGNAVLKEGKSFYDFRPGMMLSDVMDVYMPVYRGDESSHIMASHAERMKMSLCFIESVKKAEGNNPNKSFLFPYRNAMTCVTCHNPHVSVKETGSDHFINGCKSCHGSGEGMMINDVAQSNLSCTESLNLRKAVNDNCVQCHMPRNSTLDIPHVSVTDHFIRKPLKHEEVKEIKEFVTLACINNPSPDPVSRGEAFLNYFEKFEPGKDYLLDSGANYFSSGTEAEIKKNFKYLVRLAYLKRDYREVIKYTEGLNDANAILNNKSYSNVDAWTSYRIGESYFALGKKENAVTYFQHATDLAPFHLDFRNRLGQSLSLLNRHEEARKNFEFIIRENPRFASAYVSLGFLVLSVDRDPLRADSLYDKALSLDPDNEQTIINKAGSLLYLDRKEEAKKMLRILIAKNPHHEKAKALLNSLVRN